MKPMRNCALSETAGDVVAASGEERGSMPESRRSARLLTVTRRGKSLDD